MSRYQLNSVWQRLATRVQARSTLGAQDDPSEREAEHVADRVMRMADADLSNQTGVSQQVHGPLIQRLCPSCEDDVHRQPWDEEKTLQLKRHSDTRPSPVVDQPIQSIVGNLRRGGQPLPDQERIFFESRFKADFSQVRIHTDPAHAQPAARQLHARAFTLGRDIAFGAGQYRPATMEGRRLMAHELTHVVQQTPELATGPGPDFGSPVVRRQTGLRIARAMLDLPRLDRELTAGGPLTQAQGEIGFGATTGRQMDAPAQDPTLPIDAQVFLRTPRSGGASPTASSTTPPTPVSRAVVVSGIHGNERGALDIVRQLLAELRSAASPLRRDFDTIVVPAMNPGGIADNIRSNRRGVDLNRNFPGIPGMAATVGRVPPEQPETAAVRSLVQTLRPARVLALHGIGSASQGGVYADPVEGAARELACRMALRMQGTAGAGGRMTGEVNVRGNRIAIGACEARYPGPPPSVTTGQSSLGAWGPTQGAIVITHEVALKSALPATGAGRSVATIMPGIREFLLDNGRQASEADQLLRNAVTREFLTGRGGASERRLRETIRGIVGRRFRDLAEHYRRVWRPNTVAANPALDRRLPRLLTNVSQVRTFTGQSGIVRAQFAARRISRASSAADIETALRDILQTRSMPGFSRHHWGTEIDVLSPDRSKWTGASRPGALVDVIPFLQTEARRFGFFHPYTAGSPGSAGGFPRPPDPHYLEEPWHISYAPLANVLQEQWAAEFANTTGAALSTLIDDVARALARQRRIPEATMRSALAALGLVHYQTNVAPSP